MDSKVATVWKRDVIHYDTLNPSYLWQMITSSHLEKPQIQYTVVFHNNILTSSPSVYTVLNLFCYI